MRKNILIIGHNYATQFIDVYNQYSRLFDRRHYHVTIAYLTGEESSDVRERTLADEVLFLDASQSSIRGLKIAQIKRLLALCKDNQYQMVICHRYKPSYLMMWVAQFHAIPALIFVMHELGTLTSIKRRLLVASLYRENMLFAGVSNAVRDDIRKHIWRVPKQRVVTLYNAIDVELTQPQLLSYAAARSALKLSPDDFIFGHLARLVPNKDQESLIRAFSFIKPQCPNAKLIIVGSGALEAQLKQQVKALHLQQDVIFTGHIKNGFSYMRAFDCFVLSSVQEAFGRVLLEAMIAHCPIIATRSNGIPEVMADTGILTPPRNSVALSAAMTKMYNSSFDERRQIAEKAYQHMLANYGLPSFERVFWNLPLIKQITATQTETS